MSEALVFKAEWRRIYEYVATRPVGAVITFDDLSRVLERDFRRNRAPMSMAKGELQIRDRRTLVIVRGVGYRVDPARRSLAQIEGGKQRGAGARYPVPASEARDSVLDAGRGGTECETRTGPESSDRRAGASAPRDEGAEWRQLYRFLASLDRGELATYERLSQVLGRDFRKSRHPLERAVLELQARDGRTVVNVRRVGYRIARPEEHLTLARLHTERAERQLGQAGRVVQAAERRALSPAQRVRLDQLEEDLGQAAKMVDRLSARQAERTASLRESRSEPADALQRLPVPRSIVSSARRLDVRVAELGQAAVPGAEVEHRIEALPEAPTVRGGTRGSVEERTGSEGAFSRHGPRIPVMKFEAPPILQ